MAEIWQLERKLTLIDRASTLLNHRCHLPHKLTLHHQRLSTDGIETRRLPWLYASGPRRYRRFCWWSWYATERRLPYFERMDSDLVQKLDKAAGPGLLSRRK
jgi:hypothetical protein